MKKHKFGDYITQACHDCGIVHTSQTEDLPCPPWGGQPGGGTTTRPGGLDALGVVKELKEVDAELKAYYTLNERSQVIADARHKLRQLISRFEGQGTEIPAASEPEGQVR